MGCSSVHVDFSQSGSTSIEGGEESQRELKTYRGTNIFTIFTASLGRCSRGGWKHFFPGSWCVFSPPPPPIGRPSASSKPRPARLLQKTLLCVWPFCASLLLLILVPVFPRRSDFTSLVTVVLVSFFFLPLSSRVVGFSDGYK